MIGHVVGNYRILGELGRGGMGMVYRAEHVQLGRPAAVKMLLPQLSADTAIVQRFFNEARAASAIDHPGIVEIYDFGQHADGSAYIVMALLKGESLEQRMRRGPLPVNEASTILAQTASALAAAHALGIVHRDLKPDNIFLVPNEMMPFGIQPKLLDFGIAKLAGDGSPEHRTQTGMMMGTPAYMSPEQCMGKSDLDHRTDLYSLGCILFHLLGGRPPFTSEHGTGMIIAAHLRDQPPDLRTLNASVPEPLVAIVRCLLEKEPGARFQTALALRDALVHAGADAPRTKPPQMVAAEPYGATMLPTPASTTRGGSAAQIMAPATTVTPKRSKAGLVVGIAVLAAAGGAAAVVATRGDAPAPVVAAGSGSAAIVTAPADAPAASDAAMAVATTTPCPDGQSRRDDTHGHCCWDGQAYSLANRRCVGTPMCPPGQVAQAETCAVAAPATVLAESPMGPAAPPDHAKPADPASPPHPDRPRPNPIAKAGTTEAPPFTVSKDTVRPDESITVSFAKPVASPSDRRAWITIVGAQAGPTEYGAWGYVDDGATTMTFKAPSRAGTYEVRLHANYPQKTTDLRRRVPLRVVDQTAQATVTPRAQQRFVAPTTAKPGATVELHFARPLRAAAGEKFWVTVISAGAPDASYGAWKYVEDGARSATLVMPDVAGDYELRLHANYPKQTTNVVHRTRIHVDP